MKEAMFWHSADNNVVRCVLCNHFCIIKQGEKGRRGVRLNIEGKLYSLVYGKLVAESIDPIEKKPFFHFMPGSFAYSIATAGCNFSCPFCQNYQISRVDSGEGGVFPGDRITPEDVVSSAVDTGCASISYTYTEPTVFFEFAFETAQLARQKGIKNSFVTNGYMSSKALELIGPYLDAANVDLKGDEGFYKKLCRAERKAVIDNIRLMKKLGIWVEVTTLLIPEYNDSEIQIRQLAEIIKDIEPSIPWHISRFFPVYKMSGHYPTPVEKIRQAKNIGLDIGLRYVYTGNIPGDSGENTCCYSCQQVLIKRHGYNVIENKIADNRCSFCGVAIDGVFQ